MEKGMFIAQTTRSGQTNRVSCSAATIGVFTD